MDLERYGDVHSVAAVLKLYLYYLPEPLLYNQLYDSWKAASELMLPQSSSLYAQGTQTGAEQLHTLRQLVESLPSGHKELLKYMLAFLNEFATNSEITKVSSSGLATVFGPIFLPPKGTEDSTWIIQIVKRLIEEFFPDRIIATKRRVIKRATKSAQSEANSNE